MDMNSVGDNRGKIGSKVNDLYIGHSSGSARIYFKNNVNSDGHPADSGDTKMVITDSGVGIGTTSNAYSLDVQSSATTGIVAMFSNEANQTSEEALIWIAGQNKTNYGVMLGAVPEVDTPSVQDHAFIVKTNDSTGTDHTERFRISSDGNVGIGTTSPSGKIQSNAADSQVAVMAGGDVSDPQYPAFGFDGQIGSNGGRGAGMYLPSDGTLAFSTAGLERVRIDASGNLLVGKTATGSNTEGVELIPQGAIYAVRTGNVSAVFGRKTSDGSIVQFRKDGSTVGSIGTNGGRLSIGSGDVNLNFNASANSIYPISNVDGTLSDNLVDLGAATARFKDIYATNGTIQTSDINEKQDIEDLTDAETRVAVSAKGLLKKYRWKSAVEEKGNDARIHFGIMAQDLQNAFTAEGLDAGDYGMFISTTWTDDDGVEQTRLGVRYSELLAFIIAVI